MTHLPQVASYARHHWTIRKGRRGKRTITRIHLLEDSERLEELASMLHSQEHRRNDAARGRRHAGSELARRW